MGSFRLVGLDHKQFESLFEMPDGRLAEHDIVRMTAASDFGYPCRVSLQDARQGEDLLLLPYAHQPARSPYRSTGPIFVRRGAVQRVLTPDEMPAYVTQRLISVRAYDHGHMMQAAEVCDGTEVAGCIRRLFCDERMAYIHLHNAKRGCFSCAVERA